MPSNYKKKKTRLYTEEDLNKAIQEIQRDGVSMCAAAKKYNIPTTTIYDRVKNNYSSNIVGRPTAIPLAVETQLATCIKVMEKWGFGLSREEVLTMVEDFVKQNNLETPFREGKPGKDWFIAFRKRHRLSIKKAQPVEYVRKKMTDPFVVSEYFKLLKDTLQSLDLFERPHQIWNLDETSLSLDPTRTKVVGGVNEPCSRTTCGTGKENITVLTTVNAAGDKLSPLIVFKGKNVWDQWMTTTENYDFELSYAASSRGWMETEIFYNYMKKTLIPALGEQRPALIIYDGHSTHVHVNVIQLAIQNEVTILKLPPHTSHLLQPLDVSVFKSFKSKWDAKLVEWQRHNVGAKMPKNVFSQTFAETWNETSPEVIKSGFKKSGIFPFDRYVIPEDKYEPAAFRRYQEHISADAQQITEMPKSLNKLCIDVLNQNAKVAEQLNIPDQRNTLSDEKTVTLLSKLAKNDNQTRPFIANQMSTLPTCLQSDSIEVKNRKPNKVNILSNIKVNFEELMLQKITQGKKDNATPQKKKRVARGAEVITLSITKKNDEDVKQTTIGKKKVVLEGQRKVEKKKPTKDDGRKPSTSGIKSKKPKNQSKKRLKRKREQLDDSLTSISDIMSIYSETDVDYRDLEFWNEEYLDSELEEEEVELVEQIEDQGKILTQSDINIPNKNKGKGKGKKTKNEKENQNLSKDKDQQVCTFTVPNTDDTGNLRDNTYAVEDEVKISAQTDINILNKNKRKGKITKKEKLLEDQDKEEKCTSNVKSVTRICNENEETENNDKTEKEIHNGSVKYSIKDAVLVRYFIRKKWIYYIGFIENVIKKDDGYYYTVNFLKTIKKPHLAFMQTKKRDCDEIMKDLIVKKIKLDQSKDNCKFFNLVNACDEAFF